VDVIPDRRMGIHLDSLNQNLPGRAARERDHLERGDVPLIADIHVPEATGPFPVVPYLHRGAWCVWSVRDVRRITFPIATSGHVVVSLDYRLASEPPYPAAVEDAVYVARWIAHNCTTAAVQLPDILVGA
jgi:acetyl esterase/lipase